MDLQDLERITRRKDFMARRFEPRIEKQFRESQRLWRRWPRVGLFLVIGIGFAIGPLHNQWLFEADENLQSFLVLIELGVVAPICLLAAVLSGFLKAPRRLTQAIQSVAVVVITSAALLFRYLALNGQMQYPLAMLGVILIAVALFGGFSWRRIALTTLFFYVIAIAMEFWLQEENPGVGLRIYALVFMGVIALLSSYTLDTLARVAWVSINYAQALSRTDPLTKLANRTDLHQKLPKVMAQARRDQRTVGVVLLDVDHFKQLNDKHGHLFGDQVLRVLGETLREKAARRPLDLVVRFGGEEFLILWFDTSPANFPKQIDHLLETIRTMKVVDEQSEKEVPITASAGGTWLVPGRETRPERVIKVADKLLYAAKSNGRDRSVVMAYSEDLGKTTPPGG